MSDEISRVRSELADLGYETSIRGWTQGTVIEFDYRVEVGNRRGETFRLGISFQENGYPEYPPHWIHVSPPVDDSPGKRPALHDRRWSRMGCHEPASKRHMGHTSG